MESRPSCEKKLHLGAKGLAVSVVTTVQRERVGLHISPLHGFRKVSLMSCNCSINSAASSPDDGSPEFQETACKPCAAKRVTMMLILLGTLALTVGVISQIATSAPVLPQQQESGGSTTGHDCPFCTVGQDS
jgi:hypothetical protein